MDEYTTLVHENDAESNASHHLGIFEQYKI